MKKKQKKKRAFRTMVRQWSMGEILLTGAVYARAHITVHIPVRIRTYTIAVLWVWFFFFDSSKKRRARRKISCDTGQGEKRPLGLFLLADETIYGTKTFTGDRWNSHIYIKYIVIWYTRANIPSLIPHIYICHGHLQRHIIIL